MKKTINTYGIIEKIFYDGKSKLSAYYEITFIEIPSGKKLELFFRLRLKEEFKLDKQYVYQISYAQDDYILRMIRQYDSLNDYLNKKESSDIYDIKWNKRQLLGNIYWWGSIICISGLILFLLLLNG